MNTSKTVALLRNADIISMNRREFLKLLAASGASLALPAWAIESASEKDIDAAWLELQAPKINRILVQRIDGRAFIWMGQRDTQMFPITPEDYYWAEAIEDGDKFYYRADGTTVEITKYEFCEVMDNPRLYYFSTALLLHYRIKRAKDEEAAYHA